MTYNPTMDEKEQEFWDRAAIAALGGLASIPLKIETNIFDSEEQLANATADLATALLSERAKVMAGSGIPPRLRIYSQCRTVKLTA